MPVPAMWRGLPVSGSWISGQSLLVLARPEGVAGSARLVEVDDAGADLADTSRKAERDER